jgi:MscS family membrane protein
LTFLYAELKTFLSDVYFVLSLVFGTLIVWSLIDLGHDWYREKLKEAGRVDELDPVLTLLTRVARIVVVIISLSILLSNFGINITALLAALGIGGLAFSLAAQDTLADAIAGFIILADRPYRVGDRIEIQGEGTWGDVVDIGLRTTRIRTRDNRMVIVPNSLIGKSQVINYTYPDPRYRIEMHVGIAYGTDIETARRLIVETVRGVEGVLLDKPVDALYHEMGDSAMIFRVRWWIESYVDTRRVYDRVNTALQEALDAAGIKMPYPTQSLYLQLDPETTDQLSRRLRASDQPPSSP